MVTMRVLLVVTVLALILEVAYSQRINEAELNNDVLVRKRINCLLDKGPCDRTGNALKAAVPEVLARNCKKCSPQQRSSANRLISFAQQRYPNEYAQIRAKYAG